MMTCQHSAAPLPGACTFAAAAASRQMLRGCPVRVDATAAGSATARPCRGCTRGRALVACASRAPLRPARARDADAASAERGGAAASLATRACVAAAAALAAVALASAPPPAAANDYLEFLSAPSVLPLRLLQRVQETIQENKSSHNGEDFSHQNLGAANFAEAELKDANLSGCDLRAAIFSRAVLYRANLAGSDLTNAFLDYTVLRGADASGAVFAGANFVRADMGDMNVTGADFSEAVIDRYQVASLCDAGAGGVNAATGVATRDSLGCDALRRYEGFNSGGKVAVVDAAKAKCLSGGCR